MNQSVNEHAGQDTQTAASVLESQSAPADDAAANEAVAAQPAEALQEALREHMRKFDVPAALAVQQAALKQHPGDLAVLREAADLDAMRCDFPAMITRVTAFEKATGQQHPMHEVVEVARSLELPDLHVAAEAAYACLHDRVPADANLMSGFAVKPAKACIVFELMMSKEQVNEINAELEKITRPLLGHCADRFGFSCAMSEKYLVRELARAVAALTVLKVKLGSGIKAALAGKGRVQPD